MDEMKHVLSRWSLSHYTTVKSFTFWKLSVKLYNFNVPVYKAFPSHEWNETHPLTMIADQLYECKKFRFLKSES